MTEPPYFGTANEPYEPPPDRPYQLPPDEPPPDRPYQPPPDQSYQPPPDQPPRVPPPPVRPYQPPPDQPEKQRQSRRWWISGAAVIVLVAGVTILFILARTGGSSSSSSGSDSAYGRRAVDVVHELHICDNPTVDKGIATCTLPDGIGYAIVATVSDDYEQDAFVADFKNPDDGCTMVVKGYFVTGLDRGTLARALGNLEAFAANHHGYLEGGCG
jgi:hypothetical protein